MKDSPLKAIAFYLPQFHPVRENSEWWGPGFTEWTNVARARPNFEGHHQPQIPRDLGFYDLRLTETLAAQAEMARAYGIAGFCFYYYSFGGRRILETPLQKFRESSIDFPFCYCWANENWTRTWDGSDKQILLQQEYDPASQSQLLRDLLPAFRDPRYLKVNGKPIFLVYRVDLIPNVQDMAVEWRKIAREAGFADLHLCAVQFEGIGDPRPFGFDAAVEFPPHQFLRPEAQPATIPRVTQPDFRGKFLDYRRVASLSLERPATEYPWYRGVMPSWDNTARRQNSGHIFLHSSPVFYRYWLQALVGWIRRHPSTEEPLIFINAWNEWAEGAHLEPDLRYERKYLEATRQALNGDAIDETELGTEEGLQNFVERFLKGGSPQKVQGAPRLDGYDIRWRDHLRVRFPRLYESLKKIQKTGFSR